MIRQARLSDIDELVRLEDISFHTDRISRRSFKYLLTRGKALTLVNETENVLSGYAMLLFHGGTYNARLYSIAVDPCARGNGIGRMLLNAVEMAAMEKECVYIRLEVREDNSEARELYQSFGYKIIKIIPDYYEDREKAVRYEKMIAPHLTQDLVKIRYHEQSLYFTCGPASLLMAMNALDDSVEMNITAELRIWRESTSIFMTSGHGGCGPYGLALAAYRRGFNIEMYISDNSIMFIDSVRDEMKKEVMKLVQEDFIREISRLPIAVHYRSLSVNEIQDKFSRGGIPIILISSYRIYREKSPHWVIVTGFDDKFIYTHDSFVDYEEGKSPIDSINMPILKKEFEQMARYGKSRQKATIIIRK